LHFLCSTRFVMSVVAKKCRSAWKVPHSTGQPAASRHFIHSHDQVQLDRREVPHMLGELLGDERIQVDGPEDPAFGSAR
jgi:hypothetical protein